MSESAIGSPAAPHRMVDRKTEVSNLVTRLLSKKINYNIALVGHRRIGKTSILYKARGELIGRPGVAVAYFDIREHLTEPARLLASLEKAIFDAYLASKGSRHAAALSAGRKRASRLAARAASALAAKQIRAVELEIGSEGAVVPRLVMDDRRPDYGRLFVSVLQSASALAEKDGLKFVLMIDEFQDLAALSRYAGLGDVFALLRGAVQDRGPNVSFVVSGPRAHLSEAILSGGNSPLFAHFHIQPVGDLDRASSADLFTRYCRSRGSARGGGPGAVRQAAASAYGLVGGHPYYLLALADACDLGPID